NCDSMLHVGNNSIQTLTTISSPYTDHSTLLSSDWCAALRLVGCRRQYKAFARERCRSVPSFSPSMTKGPEPIIASALPGPKPSLSNSSVESASKPALKDDTACSKPGEGSEK